MYIEPAGYTSEPVYIIMSDNAVLATYWEYWSENMQKAGLDSEISKENCIQDWAVLHWAWVVTPEKLKEVVFGNL